MSTLKNVLEFILSEIKKENNSRTDNTTISDDATNQCLADIFHNAENKYTDIDFTLDDDEDILSRMFGLDGFCQIRDAEQGL